MNTFLLFKFFACERVTGQSFYSLQVFIIPNQTYFKAKQYCYDRNMTHWKSEDLDIQVFNKKNISDVWVNLRKSIYLKWMHNSTLVGMVI